MRCLFNSFHNAPVLNCIEDQPRSLFRHTLGRKVSPTVCKLEDFSKEYQVDVQGCETKADMFSRLATHAFADEPIESVSIASLISAGVTSTPDEIADDLVELTNTLGEEHETSRRSF